MKALLTLAAISAVLLAGCGPEDKVAKDESSPEPQPHAQAIRDVDLATLTWHDTPRDKDVTLTGDEPVGDLMDGGQYSLGDLAPAYADVDQDGFEDAVASLKRVEGNGLDELWYVWLWDPETETPRQVLDPVAQQERCATVVSSVEAAKGAFRFTEKYRDLADIGTCDSEPPNAVTRTITIADGSPVQTEGHGAYGGICPQPPAGDANSVLIEDAQLYVAPDAGSARVDGDDIYWVSGLPTGSSPWLELDGWVLVGFGPNTGSATFDEYGPYIPCAWAQRPS